MTLGTSSTSSSEASGPPGVSGVQPGESVPGRPPSRRSLAGESLDSLRRGAGPSRSPRSEKDPPLDGARRTSATWELTSATREPSRVLRGANRRALQISRRLRL